MTGARRRGLVARVAWGGLFLQAAYNPERRQALGVASALAPAAVLWPEPEARRRFLLRHLAMFNTNPAMAGPILGGVLRLEERAAAGDSVALDRVARLKKGLEGPFAAAGDALVWGGARPVAGLGGSAIALLAGVWGAVFLLLVYNAVHLGLRVGGVFWGYRRGDDVHLLVRGRWFRRALSAAPWLVLIGGAAAGIVALGPGATRSGPALLGGIALLAGYAAGRRRVSRGTLVAIGAIIVGLVAAAKDGGWF
jgi:mannose/fructose/N-acetylgalactosamine-specific phosphotransferase system component IID